MGQLTNLYVSSSYQGLLKMTDSTQGLTNTLQTIQTGDGDNSPLQMSLTEVNISGSFFINNVPITNGTNGTSGTSGSNGSDGSSGTSGSNGSDGSSGTSGSNGTDGSSGTSGSNGSDGSSGTSGTDGSTGSSGSDGSSGTSGSNGSDGSSGTSGSNGTDGSSGTSGSNGSDGSSGTSGSNGTDGTSGTSGLTDKTGLITTGSIVGTQSITGSLTIDGSLINTGSLTNTGDLYILNRAYNSGSVKLNISGSNSVTSSNLIFSNSTPAAANFTGSVVISGSNNILLTSQRTNIVGLYGYIGGSNNIVGTIPTLSTASLFRPTVSNNQLNGSLTMTFTTSSLGVPIISNNLIYGTTTINNPSGSMTATSNFINSTNVTSTQTITSGTVMPTLSNNLINGTQFNLNHISSSITTTNNQIFGVATVNNLYYHTGSNNSLSFSNNLTNGQGITINAGGNPQTNVARPIVGNLLGGQVITISAAVTGSDLGGLRNSVVYGYNLNVSGSHSAAQATQQGAAFFGRWNSEVDGLADSARTVFAVGTGTATGASRRTAFYITSGSIVGVSGSLLVQGPTTLSGSLNVSNGITLIGNQFKITDQPITFSSSFAIGTANDLTINYTQGVGLGIRNGNIQIGREAGQNFLNTPDTAGNFLFGQYGGQSFESGSGNVFLHTGGSTFKSGSHNTFVGRSYGTITGGTDNVILGGYDAPETNINNYMSLGNSNVSFITKRPSQPIRMSESLTITGSLRVSGDVMFASGSNKTIGTALLDGGNPGAVTVSNSLVTTSSLIFLTKQTLTNAHMVAVSSKGSGTFTITSNGNGDADTVAYQIINPA